MSDTIKDFATNGPVIRAVAKVHDMTVPVVVPIVRAAGRSAGIVTHYGTQYNDCLNADHSIPVCVTAGSAAFLTESAHRAVGGMAIGGSVELAATGVGVIPATALATAGYKVFADGRENGTVVHNTIVNTFDPMIPEQKPEKFIIPGIAGVIGEFKQPDEFVVAKPNMEKMDEIKRNLNNLKGLSKDQEKTKIIKRETKKIIDVVNNIDEINSDTMFPSIDQSENQIKDYIEKEKKITMYQSASQMVADSSYILRELGEPRLAQTIDNIQHILKISSGIDQIMSGGMMLATGGTLSAVVGGMCLINSLFGKKEKDNSMAMFNALSQMITQVFNTLMTRLFLLEQHMNQRFDQLEHKLDKLHLREYILMRDVYLQGKDIMYYMDMYTDNIKEKIEDVKTTIMTNSTDLKKSLVIINDNFNSFRFEKINELISEIDYMIGANLMTIDKIHYYLGKLFNVVINLLTNDYITGRNIKSLDTMSQITELKTNTFDRLINYFSKDIKLINPILWIVITRYTISLINYIPDKQVIHNHIINSLKTMGLQYKEFVDTNTIDYDQMIRQVNEDIAEYKSSFLQKKQTYNTEIRKRNIMRDISIYQESLDEVLKLNLFSYYTKISHRMKVSEYGEEEDGTLIEPLNKANGACCCPYRRYLFNNGSEKTAFITYAHRCSSWQFCGNGNYGDRSHHPYGCGMHRNTTSKALYSEYPERTTAAIEFLTEHSDDHLQKQKNQFISSFKISQCYNPATPPNKYLMIPGIIEPQHVIRPYCLVTYRDISLKLPINNVYIMHLTDELRQTLYNNTFVEFYVNVTYIDNADIIIEQLTLFVSKNNHDNIKITTNERTISVDDLPTKHNNNMEMLLDLYFGGLYATIKDKIKFSMRTWNHDNCNYYQNIIYTYPSIESHNHIGTFERFNNFTNIPFNVLIQDLEFTQLNIDENEIKITKDLESDSNYINLMNKKMLLELEQSKYQEIINFVHNPDFIDTYQSFV